MIRILLLGLCCNILIFKLHFMNSKLNILVLYSFFITFMRFNIMLS